jgi:hypothetical protein
MKCDRGWIDVGITLAPTMPPKIQALAIAPVLPPDVEMAKTVAAVVKVMGAWDE